MRTLNHFTFYFSLCFIIITVFMACDLVIIEISAPSEADAGESINTSFRVNNLGDNSTGASTARVLFSVDKRPSSDDVILQTLSVPAIQRYEPIDLNATVTIPENSFGRTYYLIFVVDVFDNVPEDNEDNNWAYKPIRINGPTNTQADIVATNILAPTKAISNDFITLTTDISNIGTGSAQSSLTLFRLSTDPFLGNDLVSEQQNTLYFNGAGSYAQEWQFRIPASTASGTYYLLVLTDAGERVIESNENNNLVYLPIQITKSNPDLRIDNLEYDGDFRPGSSTTITATVLNIGKEAASVFNVKFYLSFDNQLNETSDQLLKTVDINNALNPSSFRNISTNVYIENGTVPGYYYLIAKVDGDNNVEELIESNNNIVKSIIIQNLDGEDPNNGEGQAANESPAETDIILNRELAERLDIGDMEDIELKLFPNPAISHCQLAYTLKEDSDISLAIVQSNGQILRQFQEQQSAGQQNIQLNLDGLPNGLLIAVVQINGKIYHQQFVHQQ